MIALLGQFIPFILVALGVGVAVGWLIWGGPDELVDDSETLSLRADLAQMLARLQRSEAEVVRLARNNGPVPGAPAQSVSIGFTGPSSMAWVRADLPAAGPMPVSRAVDA